jgi:uncharacterized membrane protein HdeD (DUF308 family)
MSDLTASDHGPRPRTGWGWFVALGIAQLVIGVIAWFEVVAFTLAGVIFIGAMLLVAGILQIVHAFMDREWRSFLFHLLAGVLYVIGGFLMIMDPLEGAVVITALVCAALIVGGIFRIVMAVQHRDKPGWVLMLVSGIVGVVVGIMLWVMPWSWLWVIGTLIAIELIVQGVCWLQFGLGLRRTA